MKVVSTLCLFPQLLQSWTEVGVNVRALNKHIFLYHEQLLQHCAEKKYRKIDDTPYGGGPGMVWKPEPIVRAWQSVTTQFGTPCTILFCANGRPLTQDFLFQILEYQHICLLMPRYEGIDQRIEDTIVDYPISIGPYVLSGGELAGAVFLDALCRLLPNVLGNAESALTESFSTEQLEEPHYTKPAKIFEEYAVPPVLLQGNHQKIKKWREQKRAERTALFVQ